MINHLKNDPLNYKNGLKTFRVNIIYQIQGRKLKM